MKFAYDKSKAQHIINHEDIMLKTYSKINQYIYGWIEPRIYEKNLNKRQGEIDRLQNMLNSNGSNLL